MFKIWIIVACASVAACASQRGATEANLVDANNASPLGDVIYKDRCASCHGSRGEGKTGAPAVMGEGVLANAEHGFKDAMQLFDYVAKQMPMDAPGTLSLRDNWAVVTYMLGGSGIELPSGGLSEANAASIQLSD